MKVFLRIYLFLLVFVLATSIGRGFLSLWYTKNHFSYAQIALYFLIDFAIPPIILIFIKKFSTTKSFTIALVSEILLMLNVYHFYYPFQLYLAGILAGTTVVFFYVTYNTLFFENTSREKRALSSSIYVLAGPILGIIIPIIIGFVGQKWGLSSVFLVSIAILLVNLYLIKILPKFEFECHLLRSLAKTAKINCLLIIEGLKDTAGIAVIPIFTLFFIHQPLPYGVFFGYLGFVSVSATVLLGFLSDKFKKRTIILYPTTILIASMIILLGFSKNLVWWAIISGILGFILTIDGVFVTTLVLDKVHEVNEGMIGREFLLGTGRIIGMIIIFISFTLTNSPKIALILIGSLYFLFPLTLFFKKIYK